jgi:Ni,Fe-hydrogenase maturation factor
MSSAHDTSLQDAIKMGISLGAHLPDEIMVVTVESQKVYEFSETLTPPVAAAITKAIIFIRQLLLESYPTGSSKSEEKSS